MKKSWKRLTSKDYFDKARDVHKGFYTYEKAVFHTVNDKIEITCPNHGNFWQNANNHLQGSKCKKCAMELRSKSRTKTTEQFIKKAEQVHNNKYDYSKTKYTKSSNTVIIICPIHGEFKQRADVHTGGGGCPNCARLIPTNSWTFSEWEEFGLKSKNFTGFSLYVIECWNDTESFLKVGKTFVPIEKRYDYKDLMPYDYKIILREEGCARWISNLELHIHQQLKHLKVTPCKEFKGHTECYDVSHKEDILKFIKEYNGTNKNNST